MSSEYISCWMKFWCIKLLFSKIYGKISKVDWSSLSPVPELYVALCRVKSPAWIYARSEVKFLQFALGFSFCTMELTWKPKPKHGWMTSPNELEMYHPHTFISIHDRLLLCAHSYSHWNVYSEFPRLQWVESRESRHLSSSWIDYLHFFGRHQDITSSCSCDFFSFVLIIFIQQDKTFTRRHETKNEIYFD